MLQLGSRGEYRWLVGEHQLDDVLRICPEAVVNRYLAITSFDSGSLSLSDEEKAAGWESHAGIAYSPQIRGTEEPPRDVYDEWYVFERPVDLGELLPGDKNPFEAPSGKGTVCAFVNFGGFSLGAPAMKVPADMFWRQLDWICPESYIASGTYLNFVSRNAKVFTAVREGLLALK